MKYTIFFYSKKYDLLTGAATPQYVQNRVNYTLPGPNLERNEALGLEKSGPNSYDSGTRSIFSGLL